MSFKARLQAMQGKMQELQEGYVPGGNFQSIPDGEYSFRIKSTIGETSKLPKRLMVTFCFVVAEGEHEGKQVFENNIIEDNKVGAQIARGRIEDLGYEWPADDLAVLEDICEDITTRSPLVEGVAKAKENNGYTNTIIKITNVLELPEGSEGETTETATEGTEGTQTESETTEEGEVDEAMLQKRALLDLAASLGIDGFSEDNELSEMVEALQGCDLTFPRENFTDEEYGLLETLQITNLAEKPAPKAKPVLSKKSTPAPAAKPAGKIFAKKGKK